MATSTTSKTNLVAHFQDDQINSDKVYIACVRKGRSGDYEVVGKWGKRNGHLNEQVKKCCGTVDTALAEAATLFRTKTRKGYIDIADPDYDGPVTFESVKQWLEPELGSNARVTPLGDDLRRTPKRPKKDDREFEVVCVDVTGIKRLFDEGERYMAKHDPDDDSMLLVFDPYGKWQRCLAARFQEAK
jgi:predicted DNA-binding WGR domain protein